jgi:hypothetical protein
VSWELIPAGKKVSRQGAKYAKVAKKEPCSAEEGSHNEKENTHGKTN